MKWSIKNTVAIDTLTEEPLFWSNIDGWVGFESCDLFTDEEKAVFTLPIDGEWSTEVWF